MRYLTRETDSVDERHMPGGALIATDAAMFLLGAGLMFLFDATRGRRRRAVARDRALRAAREAAWGTSLVTNDLWNRTYEARRAGALAVARRAAVR
jgi:hypothetical protein